MVGEKINAKHLLDLKSIGLILKEIEYKYDIASASEILPLCTLYAEIPHNKGEKSWKMYLNFIPTSEDQLDFIKLLQIYIVVEDLSSDSKEKIDYTSKISGINETSLFGNFGINNGQIYFKYVLTIPQYFEFEREYFKELIGLIIYTIESNFSSLN